MGENQNLDSYISYESENFQTLRRKNPKIGIIIRKNGIFLKYHLSTSDHDNLNFERSYSYSDLQILFSSRQINYQYYVPDPDKLIKSLFQSPGKSLKISEDLIWQEGGEEEGHHMKVFLEIDNDFMKAYITLVEPVLKGRILELEEILEYLRDKKVVYQIKQEAIMKALVNEEYNQPILISEGLLSKKGDDAYIEFKFNINKQHTFNQDNDNKIDYRNMNTIQNVFDKQLLAEKYLAQPGQIGYNVYGEPIKAPMGNDVPFISGENTRLSEDQFSIYSTTNGMPIFQSGTISVISQYEVSGDLDFNIGNIYFVGSVLVRGNVKDGFSIKAIGNVEVKGNVQNAKIESNKDIIVSGGIIGKKKYFIKAKGNIYAKFVENALIYTDQNLIVKDNLINSLVYAASKVFCYGKKGVIFGGKIYSGYHISARYLGSSSSNYTYLHAGSDPKYLLKLEKLNEEKAKLEHGIQDIDNKIKLLEKRKKQNHLSEDKEAFLSDFLDLKQAFDKELLRLLDDIGKIESYLTQLNIDGKISASVQVYPGVSINIRKYNLDLKVDVMKKTFYEEHGMIKTKPFEAIKMDIKASNTDDGKASSKKSMK